MAGRFSIAKVANRSSRFLAHAARAARPVPPSEALRPPMAGRQLMAQDTVLFNDTVRNNLAYGHDEVALDRVREAAAAAYADEFILAMPKGYETVIGESGAQLSGGERQRLAIARALFKDAPILILDEATSQLDTESENEVQKALKNLLRGRTTLVIAHRLSTIVSADEIIVMEKGRIIEQGSHEELLRRAGVYRRLYDLQFKV